MAHDVQGSEAPLSATRRRRVLVVEDDAVLAAELAMILEEAGYEAVGPAASIRQARRLIAGEPLDAAVLDINLGARAERDGAAVAHLLCDLRVPFVFVSAYGRGALDPPLKAFAHLPKPVSAENLIRQLKANMGAG